MQKFPVQGDGSNNPLTFVTDVTPHQQNHLGNTVVSNTELSNHQNTIARPSFQSSGQMDKVITALPVVNDLLKSAAMLTQNCKDLIQLFRSMK
jgi:hypothetical protein